MEKMKNDMIELVNKAKEEIEIIRNGVVENNETLEKIKNIKTELTQVEKAIKPIKNDLDKKAKRLDAILDEISNIKGNIILNDQEKIFEVIEKNLPDDMYLQNIEGDELMKIILYGNREVGNIKILMDYKPEIKIKVEVYNNIDEFTIHDPLKVYNIISFIITKFNYKEQ